VCIGGLLEALPSNNWWSTSDIFKLNNFY
jgi:hypothetical protein